jgi:hypothetical protein
LYFWIANCKTEDPAPNDNKHSLTSGVTFLFPVDSSLHALLSASHHNCFRLTIVFKVVAAKILLQHWKQIVVAW